MGLAIKNYNPVRSIKGLIQGANNIKAKINRKTSYLGGLSASKKLIWAGMLAGQISACKGPDVKPDFKPKKSIGTISTASDLWFMSKGMVESEYGRIQKGQVGINPFGGILRSLRYSLTKDRKPASISYTARQNPLSYPLNHQEIYFRENQPDSKFSDKGIAGFVLQNDKYEPTVTLGYRIDLKDNPLTGITNRQDTVTTYYLRKVLLSNGDQSDIRGIRFVTGPNSQQIQKVGYYRYANPSGKPELEVEYDVTNQANIPGRARELYKKMSADRYLPLPDQQIPFSQTFLEAVKNKTFKGGLTISTELK